MKRLLQAGDLDKSDLLRECGYASSGKNGHEILDFASFYEALLEAKGIDIEHSDQDSSDSNAIECNVLVDGCTRIPLPEGIHRSPTGKYGILVDEWASYYPGRPVRVFTLDEDLRIPKNSDCNPEYSDCFNAIASSVGDFLVIEGNWLKSGQRYIVEAQEDEWHFALEPMPWNGLEDVKKECLRLLVIPKTSVSDLLSLCHPEQDSLFDPNQFESFEAALANSLGHALALNGSESLRAILAEFNRSESDLEEYINRNWLCHDIIESLPFLNKVLKEFATDKIHLETKGGPG